MWNCLQIAFDQWCLRHILRIPYIAHATNDEVRSRTCQPPATHLITTRRLRLFGRIALVHPKTTRVLCEQPSVVCLWTGIAHLVDQDEPGFERLSSTSSSTISASTWRGSVRRTVPSGENSWRQLCPAKDAPPDDDDDVKLSSTQWEVHRWWSVRLSPLIAQLDIVLVFVCQRRSLYVL